MGRGGYDDYGSTPAGNYVAGGVWVSEKMDERIRQNFARKVLGLTAGMLSVTSALCMLFKGFLNFRLRSVPAFSGPNVPFNQDTAWLLAIEKAVFLPDALVYDHRMEPTAWRYNQPQLDWIQGECSSWRLIAALLSGIGFVYTIFLLCGVKCCCSGLLRSVPTNYILVYTLGVCYGFIVNGITMFAPLYDIGLAMLGTSGTLVILYFLAKHIELDLTGMRLWCWLLGHLFMFLVVILLLPLVFVGKFHWAGFIVNAIALCLTLFYLVWDFQMIIGGKHRRAQFSTDDYAWAAVQLYLDVVELFLLLLDLLGKMNRRE